MPDFNQNNDQCGWKEDWENIDIWDIDNKMWSDNDRRRPAIRILMKCAKKNEA